MSDMGEDLTRRLLVDAGIIAGMRVLDIGCGRGDVTLLAARLVGEDGHVLGIDRTTEPLEAARTRARELACGNVEFAQTDLNALSREHGTFDAVVGRRVLMYQPDAVACLARVADVLAPGGLIVLQEHDSTSMPICRPAMPLHEQVNRWMWQTVAHEGADVHFGMHMGSALRDAGFMIECIRAETTVLTTDQTHHIETIMRAMLERIVAAGVASPEEIMVDTLDERLAAERKATNATCIWELIFGAWARKAA
jgi:2-polyprenyl-3-methyl-5-hydroxy-6-metoxy-1,4-benzoquinol methylase